MRKQLLSIIRPNRLGRVFNATGPFRASTGPDGPVVSLASDRPVPWPGGLTEAVSLAASLIGDTTPTFDRDALSLFDEMWGRVGGVVSVEFGASEDWLDYWSLTLKQVLVPKGWGCDICRQIVTDAVHSITHRSKVAIETWTQSSNSALRFVPVSVCSERCRDWAAEHCLEAERCQRAKLEKLRGLRLPPKRRIPQCSA